MLDPKLRLWERTVTSVPDGKPITLVNKSHEYRQTVCQEENVRIDWATLKWSDADGQVHTDDSGVRYKHTPASEDHLETIIATYSGMTRKVVKKDGKWLRPTYANWTDPPPTPPQPKPDVLIVVNNDGSRTSIKNGLHYGMQSIGLGPATTSTTLHEIRRQIRRAPRLDFVSFAAVYCERQDQTPNGLKQILQEKAARFQATGFMLLECAMLDSSRLGELTILPYGGQSTYKEVPSHPISPRGLASDMSAVVATLDVHDLPQ